MLNTAQIEAFQASHFDWEWKPLTVDGNVGPRTQWALALQRIEPARQEIVQRACSSVGRVSEQDGTNRSPQIDFWNQRCGAPLGSPWCASFASWCFSVDAVGEVRESSAQELGRSLRSVTLILPGDLMWFETGRSTGHCGIVIGLGSGEVACVEGNHFDGVHITRRLTSEVHIATPFPVQSMPQCPLGVPLVRTAILGTR